MSTEDLITIDIPVPAPYVPSELEARNYYYGLESGPRLIARSSPNVWKKPTGPEAFMEPKELTPLGMHPLNTFWEKTVGPAMDLYFQEKGVECTSMIPLRIGIAGQSSPPPVIFVGVNPGSLTPEFGIEVALHCRYILLQNGIDDVHVEIRESTFSHAAMMYKPAISANPVAVVREPFSTSLGLPICNSRTPNYEGIGGLFFTDSAKPGILHLLTSCIGMRRRNVMLLGEAAFKDRLKDIEVAISDKKITVHRLAFAEKMEDEEDATAERRAIKPRIDEANEAIEALEKLLANVTRDWEKEENRIIGHVVLSPPISFDYGDDGFIEDWAVVEIYPTKISRLNFVGNAVDLGSIEAHELISWILVSSPNSFDYPGDRLLRCFGTVPDREIFRPNPSTKDQHGDPVIMVAKNGNASKLTVGRLNTIRSFVREYSHNIPSKMSKEISVLPRDSKSGPFSARGDSGSVVIDGSGSDRGISPGNLEAHGLPPGLVSWKRSSGNGLAAEGK
ncbi:hypothetical protein V8E54_000857 [Elaphomyces granulatus]